jgi:hypothetical protein
VVVEEGGDESVVIDAVPEDGPAPAKPQRLPVPAPLPVARPYAPLAILIDARDGDVGARARANGSSGGRTVAEKMRLVNVGLAFYYTKLVLVLVAIFMQVTVGLMMAADVRALGFLIFLAVLYFLISITMTVSGMVGSILCCFVARKSRLRPLSIVAATLDGAAFVLSLVGGLLLALDNRGGVVPAVLGLLLGFIGWLLFMLFLSKLADFIDEDAAAAEIFQIMVIDLALLIGGPLAIVAVAACFLPAPQAGVVVICLLMLGMFAVYVQRLIRLVEILGEMREKIRDRWR